MILVSMLGSGRPIVLALSSTLSVVQVCAATGEHSVWPNTIVKGAPSFSSNSRTSAAGTVEPPEQIALTDERSVVGECRMLQHRDQHGGNADHRIAAIGPEHFEHDAGSKASTSTWVAAFETAPITQQTQPPVWNSGIVVMKTSPASTPMRSAVSAPLLSSPRWRSRAPFGKPVVPEVYWIMTGSSGLTTAA